MRPARTPEVALSWLILEIAATIPSGFVTYGELRKWIPQILDLTEGDLAWSDTKPKERMFEQILRNVAGHAGGKRRNPVALGYLDHIPRKGFKITAKGRERVGRDLLHALSKQRILDRVNLLDNSSI